MTVRIMDLDAFNRIAAVEGDYWRENFSHDCNEGFNAFRRRWEDVLAYASENGGEPSDYVIGYLMTDYNNTFIYGAGGFHRYMVSPTGELIFSASHALRSGVDRAIAEGFATVGQPEKGEP